MSQLYRDPRTGRAYTVDASGQSRWVDDPDLFEQQRPSEQHPTSYPAAAADRSTGHHTQTAYQQPQQTAFQPQQTAYLPQQTAYQPQSAAALPWPADGASGHGGGRGSRTPAGRPWYRRGWFVAPVSLLTGVVLGSMLSGGDDATSTAAADQPSDRPSAQASAPAGGAAASKGAEKAAGKTATKAAEKAVPKQADKPAAKAGPGIGTPVRDGKFEFTVTGVKTASSVGQSGLSKQAQGQFLIYAMTVQNVGDEAQLFDASNQKLLGADGKQYSADSAAGIYLGEAGNAFLNQINPGNTVKGQIVFDVPKGTEVSELELHDSMFSGGVKVALTK